MSFLIASPGQEPPKGWDVVESVRVESKKDLDKFLHDIEKGDNPVESFALWPKTGPQQISDFQHFQKENKRHAPKLHFSCLCNRVVLL